MKPLPSAPELTCVVRDGGEVVGFLVVDSFVNGRSHGGVRMRQDISEQELRLLARTMTMKYGFLGLPFGGAKAGVIGDPEAPREEKRRRLARFGRALLPLLEKGIFVPAGDMGTDHEDIRSMLVQAGVRLGRRRLPRVSSGAYTAHSVFASACVLAEAQGFGMQDARVAIQGFGAVGSTLARLMHAAGAHVVAISTSRGGLYDPHGLDVPALVEAVGRWGSALVDRMPSPARVERDAVLALPADILCPCAAMHSIHEGNAEEVRARVICPGANNPWTETAELILEKMGILLLPDFAANAGGILGTVMSYAGFPRDEIEAFIRESFTKSTRYLLKGMQREGVPVRKVAEALVERRRVPVARAGAPGMAARVMSLGLWFHRRGLVPGPLMRVLSRPYFRGKMAEGLSNWSLQASPQPVTEAAPKENGDSNQVTGS